MTNEDWVNIFNDGESYSKLYTDYYKKFYNYGKKFTSNTSLIEDSVQEVFLEIWLKKHKLLQVNSINSYFFASFRYILFRKIKEEKKIVSNDGIEGEASFSVDSLLISREVNNEQQARLKTAFEALTPHQREAIFLRFYQNLSYEEVAQVLNISVKATYKIMARSLSALKSRMLIALALLLNILSLKFILK